MGNTQVTSLAGYEGLSGAGCDCTRKSKYFERERCEKVACCRRYSFGRLVNANHDLMMRIGGSYHCGSSQHDLTTRSMHSFITSNRPYLPFGQSPYGKQFLFDQQPGYEQHQKPPDSNNFYNPVTKTLRGHEPLNPFNPKNAQTGPDQPRTGVDKSNFFDDPNINRGGQPFADGTQTTPEPGKTVGTGPRNVPISTTGTQGAPGEGPPGDNDGSRKRGMDGPGTKTDGKYGPGAGPTAKQGDTGNKGVAEFGGPKGANTGKTYPGDTTLQGQGIGVPSDIVPKSKHPISVDSYVPDSGGQEETAKGIGAPGGNRAGDVGPNSNGLGNEGTGVPGAGNKGGNSTTSGNGVPSGGAPGDGSTKTATGRSGPRGTIDGVARPESGIGGGGNRSTEGGKQLRGTPGAEDSFGGIDVDRKGGNIGEGNNEGISGPAGYEKKSGAGGPGEILPGHIHEGKPGGPIAGNGGTNGSGRGGERQNGGAESAGGLVGRISGVPREENGHDVDGKHGGAAGRATSGNGPIGPGKYGNRPRDDLGYAGGPGGVGNFDTDPRSDEETLGTPETDRKYGAGPMTDEKHGGGAGADKQLRSLTGSSEQNGPTVGSDRKYAGGPNANEKYQAVPDEYGQYVGAGGNLGGPGAAQQYGGAASAGQSGVGPGVSAMYGGVGSGVGEDGKYGGVPGGASNYGAPPAIEPGASGLPVSIPGAAGQDGLGPDTGTQLGGVSTIDGRHGGGQGVDGKYGGGPGTDAYNRSGSSADGGDEGNGGKYEVGPASFEPTVSGVATADGQIGISSGGPEQYKNVPNLDPRGPEVRGGSSQNISGPDLSGQNGAPVGPDGKYGTGPNTAGQNIVDPTGGREESGADREYQGGPRAQGQHTRSPGAESKYGASPGDVSQLGSEPYTNGVNRDGPRVDGSGGAGGYGGMPSVSPASGKFGSGTNGADEHPDGSTADGRFRSGLESFGRNGPVPGPVGQTGGGSDAVGQHQGGGVPGLGGSPAVGFSANGQGGSGTRTSGQPPGPDGKYGPGDEGQFLGGSGADGQGGAKVQSTIGSGPDGIQHGVQPDGSNVGSGGPRTSRAYGKENGPGGTHGITPKADGVNKGRVPNADAREGEGQSTNASGPDGPYRRSVDPVGTSAHKSSPLFGEPGATAGTERVPSVDKPSFAGPNQYAGQDSGIAASGGPFPVQPGSNTNPHSLPGTATGAPVSNKTGIGGFDNQGPVAQTQERRRTDGEPLNRKSVGAPGSSVAEPYGPITGVGGAGVKGRLDSRGRSKDSDSDGNVGASGLPTVFSPVLPPAIGTTRPQGINSPGNLREIGAATDPLKVSASGTGRNETDLRKTPPELGVGVQAAGPQNYGVGTGSDMRIPTTNVRSSGIEVKDDGRGTEFPPGHVGQATQSQPPEGSAHGIQTESGQQRYSIQQTTDPFTSSSGVQNEPGFGGVPISVDTTSSGRVPQDGKNAGNVPGSEFYGVDPGTGPRLPGRQGQAVAGTLLGDKTGQPVPAGFMTNQTSPRAPTAQGQQIPGFPNARNDAAQGQSKISEGLGGPGGTQGALTAFPYGQVGPEGALVSHEDSPGVGADERHNLPRGISVAPQEPLPTPYDGTGTPDSNIPPGFPPTAPTAAPFVIPGQDSSQHAAFPGFSPTNLDNANDPSLRKTGTNTKDKPRKKSPRARISDNSVGAEASVPPDARQYTISGEGTGGKGIPEISTKVTGGAKKPVKEDITKGKRKGTGFSRTRQESSESNGGVNSNVHKSGGAVGVKRGAPGNRGGTPGRGSPEEGVSRKVTGVATKGEPSVKKSTPGKQGPNSGDNSSATKKGLKGKPSQVSQPHSTRNPYLSKTGKSKPDGICIDDIPDDFTASPEKKKKKGANRQNYQSPFTIIYPSTGECPQGTVRTKEGFFAIPKDSPRSRFDSVRRPEQDCTDRSATKKKLCVSGSEGPKVKKSKITAPKKIRPCSQKDLNGKSKDAKLMEELEVAVGEVMPMSKRRKRCSSAIEAFSQPECDLSSLPMSEESFQRLKKYLEKYLKEYTKLLNDSREEDILRICSAPYQTRTVISGPPREYYPSSSQGYGNESARTGACNARSTFPCSLQQAPCNCTSSNSSNLPSYRVCSADHIVINNSPALSDVDVGKDGRKEHLNEEFDRAEQLTLDALKFSHKNATPEISSDSLLLQINPTAGDLDEYSGSESRDALINEAIQKVLKDLSAYKQPGVNHYVFSKENLPEINGNEVGAKDEDSCTVTKINSCSSSATMTPDTPSLDSMRNVTCNPTSSQDCSIHPPSVADSEANQTTESSRSKPLKSNLKSKQNNSEVMKSRSVRFSDPVVRDSWIMTTDDIRCTNGNTCAQKPYYVAMYGQPGSGISMGGPPEGSRRVSSSDCKIQSNNHQDQENRKDFFISKGKEPGNGSNNKFKSHLV